MNRAAILACCLVLAGCGIGQRIAAEQRVADDAKCQGYGAKPGEPPYVQCRAQLDAARTQATATRNAAPGAVILPW